MTDTREESAERKWVGKSINRVEDTKFLLGRGGYIDDFALEGMLHAALVRSPYAHARINSIDTEEARRHPGVVAVVTGAEAAELSNPMPDFGPAPAEHEWRCLAADKARYFGQGVAAVVAESRAIAEDACDLVRVEYEPLAPVVDPEAAMEPDAEVVHETVGSNIAMDRNLVFGEVERDFAEADIVVKDRLRWRRSNAQPLETVGAVANFDPGTGIMTIHTNTLNMTQYLFMFANTLNVPSNKLDIHPYPAGGSFGSKFAALKAAAIAGMLSKVTSRPVKFMEDRFDNIVNCDYHGSDRIYYAELAATNDGIMKSLRLKVIDDYGAYMHYGVGTHGNAMAQVVGPYRIGSVQYHVQAILTNKCQQGPYRGFGSEVNNWMLERLVDLLARELEMDPVEIRRKNFIQPDQFPYFIPNGNVYDSGDYEGVLDKALELADYDSWREEQKRLREEGRYIGIGVATTQERSVLSATEFWFWFDEPEAPVTSTPESVTLNVDATGNVTATLYSGAFWGNSPETMVAQLVAEELDVDPQQVSVVYSGTNQGLPGFGPGGSRFTTMIAGAIEGASGKIKKKAFKIAEHLLEAAEGDLEWTDGGVAVKGSPDRRKDLSEIAMNANLFKHQLPAEIESGLGADQVYDHPYTTMPSEDRKDLGVFYPFMGHACHIAVVEVDVETGLVEFLKYTAVHDCGTVVNPRSLSGQVIGGTAQGIGTALLEEFVYDEEGRLTNASYQDYLIPSAMEIPEMVVGHHETPSPYTVHGIKGGGEGGRMVTPSSVSSAIDDALKPLGVYVNELPATPERVLGWIEEAKARNS
jgi:carbon-monoxide dehydrogenase large subunit